MFAGLEQHIKPPCRQRTTMNNHILHALTQLVYCPTDLPTSHPNVCCWCCCWRRRRRQPTTTLYRICQVIVVVFSRFVFSITWLWLWLVFDNNSQHHHHHHCRRQQQQQWNERTTHNSCFTTASRLLACLPGQTRPNVTSVCLIACLPTRTRHQHPPPPPLASSLLYYHQSDMHTHSHTYIHTCIVCDVVVFCTTTAAALIVVVFVPPPTTTQPRQSRYCFACLLLLLPSFAAICHHQLPSVCCLRSARVLAISF